MHHLTQLYANTECFWLNYTLGDSDQIRTKGLLIAKNEPSAKIVVNGVLVHLTRKQITEGLILKL